MLALFDKIGDISVSSLKQYCSEIHYFGLGFIQVKLGETFRMHFYNSTLPAIVNFEEIHNHRYDFFSKVLAGTFRQIFYEVDRNPKFDTEFLLEEESCKEGVMASASPIPVGIKKVSEQTLLAGSSYTVSHDLFHQVHANFAITFLTRGNIVKENAEVIRKKGAEKVCPFSKKIPDSQLWSTVESMLLVASGTHIPEPLELKLHAE